MRQCEGEAFTVHAGRADAVCLWRVWVLSQSKWADRRTLPYRLDSSKWKEA